MCEIVDIIIGGINLVNEEHPYWNSGFWLFRSDTGIQAVFCRIIMISFTKYHQLWISNNILASEKFWLHFLNFYVLPVCNFPCQERKEIFWISLIHRIKVSFVSSDLYYELVGLSKDQRRKHRRMEHSQATLPAAHISNMLQRFSHASPSTQLH